MNKETLKNQILIQHGIVKGLEKQSKVFKLKFDTILSAVDLEIKNAELEERGYGGFEDCGSFYKSMLDKAEGKKSGLKDSESILIDMVKLIKSEHHVLKQLKKEFIDLFGQDTFDSEIQSNINEYGKIKLQSNEKELKDKKEFYKAAKILVSIFFSHSLYSYLKKDYHEFGNSLLKRIHKNNLSYINTDFTNYKIEDFEAFFNKNKYFLEKELLTLNDFLMTLKEEDLKTSKNERDLKISLKDKEEKRELRKLLNYKEIFEKEFLKINT